MDIKSAGSARRYRLAAVASACAAVHGWAMGSAPARASDPSAGAASAQLAVSATVVRRCAVATPGRVALGRGMPADVSGSVTVVCSAGDRAAVRISPLAHEGALSLRLPARAGDAPAILLPLTSVPASGPLVVTVLF